MKISKKTTQKLLSLGLLLASLQACAPESLVTSEGGLGALLGGGAGVGGGYIAHAIDDDIDDSKAAAIGGGIGAGLGLIVGAMVHEKNIEAEAKRPIVRVPVFMPAKYRDLEDARYNVEAEGADLRPWTKKYWGESYSTPYQGHRSGVAPQLP